VRTRDDRGARSEGDARRLLWPAAGVICLIVVLAIFARPEGDLDRTPSAGNAGPYGAKAAYLLLPRIGYRVRQWQQPLGSLAGLDAADTTLVLAEPDAMQEESLKIERDALLAFLRRGGHVLATGMVGGALLSDGAVGAARRSRGSVCNSQGVGASELARLGAVPIEAAVAWRGDGKTSPLHSASEEVLQRCGPDAVVVRVRVGAGEAVWWAGPTPLSNSGLHDDPSLRLLLLSLGETSQQEPRSVLFDEYVHGDRQGAGSLLSGLPLRSLGLQACLVALLLVFSFSRRFGPLRAPATVGRTSPLEFAWSMGALYEKAGATGPPIQAALRRLTRLLMQQCSAPAQLFLPERAGALSEYLSQRLGSGDWEALERDMQRAAGVEYKAASRRQALALARALHAHAEALDKRLHANPTATRAHDAPAPVRPQQTTKARSA
jgi:hypothetical protein